jgi:phosphoglycolate phosphatase-like HAD superfamily hydrolase
LETKLVIWDLDGTLFDGGERVHLIPEDKSRTENWDAFNKACADDKTVPQMLSVFKALEAQLQDGSAPFHDIVFVTARTETCLEETYEGLFKAGIDGYRLYMRGEDEHCSSADYKSRIIDELESEGNVIYMAFDDDKLVVEMMKERGIFTIHVAEWWKYGWKVNK